MWLRHYQLLSCFQEITIPRLIVCTNSTKIEIHGVCDALKKAYGACLYMRSINSTREVQSKIICAKSRVASLKRISLPRLELCGALLLAELMSKTTKALTLMIKEVHYWCDFTITLAWINEESFHWKTFVANRVARIQELLKTQWHHVKFQENPVDLLSTGVHPGTLKNLSL